MIRARDISGQKFNRLTAIRFIERKENKTFWLFKCDCGKEKIISMRGVIYKHYGHAKSCGCFGREVRKSKKNIERLKLISTKHNMSRTRFYSTWYCIKGRCYSIKNKAYDSYGGRGIRVCKRWHKFENFRDDMLESYEKHVKEFGEKNTTIERINVNDNYKLKNCKWATLIEQNNNRRDSHFLTYNGKKMTMAEWARELNVPYYIIRSRINQLNWSIEKTLNTPYIEYKKYLYNKKTC